MSVSQQCALLELPRASYYRQPQPESDKNLQLMRLIDETYLEYPFFGSRQMRNWLRLRGHRVNRKRVQRLIEVDPGSWTAGMVKFKPSKIQSCPRNVVRLVPSSKPRSGSKP
ncbi:MAG: transposase [Opitutaceae bacterium]|nr:transposase [Opitutaceae bacterium]